MVRERLSVKKNVLEVKQTEGDMELIQFHCCSVEGLVDCAGWKVAEMQGRNFELRRRATEGLACLPERKREW